MQLGSCTTNTAAMGALLCTAASSWVGQSWGLVPGDDGSGDLLDLLCSWGSFWLACPQPDSGIWDNRKRCHGKPSELGCELFSPPYLVLDQVIREQPHTSEGLSLFLMLKSKPGDSLPPHFPFSGQNYTIQNHIYV